MFNHMIYDIKYNIYTTTTRLHAILTDARNNRTSVEPKRECATSAKVYKAQQHINNTILNNINVFAHAQNQQVSGRKR